MAKNLRTVIVVVGVLVASASGLHAYQWSIDKIEGSGAVVQSLAVEPDNTIHAFGRRTGVGMLHFTLLPGAMTRWQREVLPESYCDDYGCGIDSVIDASGRIHLSFDRDYESCWYRCCDGGKWREPELVVSGLDNGHSIALDPADGTPKIATVRKMGRDTWQLLYCERDPGSGTWSEMVVDEFVSGRPWMLTPSLAFASDGTCSISYIVQGYHEGELRCATHDGTGWVIDALDTWVLGDEDYPSASAALVLDGDEYPCIAYSTGEGHGRPRELRVTRWNGVEWTLETVMASTSRRDMGWDVDAAFSRGGNLHIAHSAFYGPIQHAYWDGSAWQNEVITDVDGLHNRLVFDSNNVVWQSMQIWPHSHTGYAVIAHTEVDETIRVVIDIKPCDDLAVINLGSQGVIPVAIMTTEDFDATCVDPETVVLAGAGIAVRGKSGRFMAHIQDVDGDGDLDLLIQVETENLDPASLQSGTAILTGSTYSGENIEGESYIFIVPSK